MKYHTEIEKQHSHQAKMFLVNNSLTKKILAIEDVGDYIPGSVMVQDLDIMVNTYMNQFGCDFLRNSSEELRLMGGEYFDRFFPAEEMKLLKPELFQLVKEQDTNKLHSFYQRVRPNADHDYSWYLTTSRLYPAEHAAEGYKMVHIAIAANMLSYAGKKLNQLVGEDIFIRQNLARFNLLTSREKQIISLIVEGRSSYEIAESLFISQHTVNAHRKNIIHKLENNSLCQLVKIAVCFGLV